MKRKQFSFVLVAIVAIAALVTLRTPSILSTTKVNNLEATGTIQATGETIALAGVRLTTAATGPILISGSGSPSGSVTATQGSIYVRTGTAQVYQNTTGSTVWTQLGAAVTFSGAFARRNAGVQSITNNTFTAILFDAEDFDTASYHSTSSNTERLTAPTTGYYLVSANMPWDNCGGNVRKMSIFKNTGEWYTASDGDNASGMFMVATTIVQLNAGEYVKLMVWQNTGSNCNVAPWSSISTFAITLLGS